MGSNQVVYGDATSWDIKPIYNCIMDKQHEDRTDNNWGYDWGIVGYSI